MDAVESIVGHIQALSNSPAELNELTAFLKRAQKQIRSESTRLFSALPQLDPSIHSLGYLFILDGYNSAPNTKERASEIIPIVARFVRTCSANQIRLAPDKFIAVCRNLRDQVMLLQSPMRGVAPMLTAIRKLQSSAEHLTVLHPDFLLLCLSSKCYKSGLSILQDEIYEVDHLKDLLLYGYYGGMICIGMKHFRNALDLLHNVITAPMTNLSAIAVEAYKKYILVSLIHLGQFIPDFPKYTSSAAQKNLNSLAQPYLELALAYGTGRLTEQEKCVQKYQERFERDNNFGLVRQVISSTSKRNIQRLTQTYLTLSLRDIADRVQLNSAKEAEMHVLQMIQDDEIFATINQKDGMVTFQEDPEQYKSCEMIERIDSSIQRIMTLSKKLSTKNEELSCDRAYLSRAGKERRPDFDDYDAAPHNFM
ncbi:COP9 signalosome complex subunit 3 [Heracleum sosnowskyi]|uniref:COP9 signalosome complex subunit 3 n=1 Tax=Heracleum sosnowskyi TaxID=360622 RepID=A0AAD8JIM8_9APIA|nr:COP9 signalosome complex subunit 3 [Heracleum sosnowskyi]